MLTALRTDGNQWFYCLLPGSAMIYGVHSRSSPLYLHSSYITHIMHVGTFSYQYGSTEAEFVVSRSSGLDGNLS